MSAPSVWKASQSIRSLVPKIRCLARPMSKLYPTDDELYTRTTVNLLAKDEQAKTVPLVNNFSVRGFKISGDTVVGPVAILPRCLVHWNVGNYHDINEDSLTLFHLLEPRLEILVLGLGAENHRLDPELHKFFRRKNIAMEVQNTANACATYNFLVTEGRIVAAGLIPPEYREKEPEVEKLPSD
ncbi:NADH dehydrogenase [ubiquinone] 1 alpha subcomplex assembly factor 3-like [Amphiura filiformis]|uniref:NADH dehydrogenase [ubiquinone] 1 alpha subcomplex assembly factor 3-like n=1 Tax=Amphiura filiformis TaxID=82378 RepID=UPI003B225A73